MNPQKTTLKNQLTLVAMISAVSLCAANSVRASWTLYDNFAAGSTKWTVHSQRSGAGNTVSFGTVDAWFHDEWDNDPIAMMNMDSTTTFSLADSSSIIQVAWDQGVWNGNVSSHGQTYGGGLSSGAGNAVFASQQGRGGSGVFGLSGADNSSAESLGLWLHYELSAQSTGSTLKVYTRNSTYTDPDQYAAETPLWTQSTSSVLALNTALSMHFYNTIPYGSGNNFNSDTTSVDNVYFQLARSGTPFTHWIGTFSGLGDLTPAGDPDADGMSNLLEFVLNGDPGHSDTGILPQLNVSATAIEFAFTRRTDSLAVTTQVFEYGSDLSAWTDLLLPAASGTVGAATITVIDAGSTQSVTISIPKTANANGRIFGRLRVYQP